MTEIRYSIVIPTIGRPSLDRLLAGLVVASGFLWGTMQAGALLLRQGLGI